MIISYDEEKNRYVVEELDCAKYGKAVLYKDIDLMSFADALTTLSRIRDIIKIPNYPGIQENVLKYQGIVDEVKKYYGPMFFED